MAVLLRAGYIASKPEGKVEALALDSGSAEFHVGGQRAMEIFHSVRGRRYVIMQALKGGDMTYEDLRRVLDREDFQYSDAALRADCSALMEKRLIERRRPGRAVAWRSTGRYERAERHYRGAVSVLQRSPALRAQQSGPGLIE